MKFIMFTKHLEGWDLAQISEGLQAVGVEGADLCTRPGYPVNPENASTALPEAAKQFAAAGLSIPMITTPGDFTDPNIDYAEKLFGACAEAGVTLLKLGYWHLGPEEDYWTRLDAVRRDMEGFAELSRRFGVKSCVHNHSGRSMGLNSCAAMNIVRDFDPQHVGVFSDTGHLSIVGEPISMALGIVREYLSIIAFKDLLRQRGEKGWRTAVVPMGEGFVEWDETLATLQKLNYQGPVSFHSEYSGEPPERVVEMARQDVSLIRAKLAG